LGLQSEILECEKGYFRVTLRKNRPEPPKEERGLPPEGQAPLAVAEKARQVFQKAGLAFPEIPQELSVRLKELRPWLFSTRPINMSPYNLEHYVRERGRRLGDYAVLSHSGHGVNSYAIQYYLVHGCLRMFLHLSWGGVYDDAEEAAAAIRNCFSMANRLVQGAASMGKLNANKQITVVVSDLYGSYWTAPGQKAQEGRTNPTAVLGEAIDWLAAYRPRAV
jgi:hypothetical protein